MPEPGFLTGSRDHGAEIWPASGFATRRQYWTYWQGAKKRWRDKDQARARRDCEKSGLKRHCGDLGALVGTTEDRTHTTSTQGCSVSRIDPVPTPPRPSCPDVLRFEPMAWS